MSSSKKIKFSKTFFLTESLLFLVSQILGLYVGWRLYQIVEIREAIEEQSYSLWQFLLFFLIGTAVVLLFIKFVKSKAMFGGLFYFLIFLGCMMFFDAFGLGLVSIGLALIIVLLRRFFASVLTHDLAIVLSVAGMGAYFGLSFGPLEIIIILVALSIYDYIAVFKTKHMVQMFKKMADKGAAFAIIAPSKWKGFVSGVSDVKPGVDFIYLGTGDLAFPLIFAVSALRDGLLRSVLIIIGALFGVLAINFYFYFRARKAFPALPPIAFGSIIGYLISLIFC